MYGVILGGLMGFGCADSYAQVESSTAKEAHVVISGGRGERQITVGGRTYRLHTVGRRETLYAISKSYKVSQAAIVKCNPSLYEGLKEGMVLRIPIPESEKPKPQTDGYRVHIVEAGETLFSIARTYGISIHSLREANKLRSGELGVSEVIRIPIGNLAQHYDSVHEAKKLKPGQIVVGKGETLYGIARSHGTSVAALIDANPELKERGLVEGMRLSIPCPSSSIEPSSTHWTPSQAKWAEVPGYTRLPSDRMCEKQNPWPLWKPLEVALILPFNVPENAVESPANDSLDTPMNKPRWGDGRFLDFYQGFLLGLEGFKQRGAKINLHVYDTKRSIEVVRQLVEADSLSNANLIVGPVYPRNIQEVANFGAQNRISVVSPLSDKTNSTVANPFLFQVNPSELTQLRQMVAQLNYSALSRIVILHEESLEDAELTHNVQLMIQSELSRLAGHHPQVEAITVPRGTPTAKFNNRITQLLRGEGKTAVIIPSTSEPFISDALGELSRVQISRKSLVEVYGMPKWQKMNNLDFDQLVNLNVTLFSPFYVAYRKPNVIAFVDAYRQDFRAEPSQFAFQGYDIARYFLEAFYTYGEDFRFCLGRIGEEQTQNRFIFPRQQGYASHENRGIFLLRFDAKEGIRPLP